jgi:hypothetical protein
LWGTWKSLAVIASAQQERARRTEGDKSEETLVKNRDEAHSYRNQHNNENFHFLEFLHTAKMDLIAPQRFFAVCVVALLLFGCCFRASASDVPPDWQPGVREGNILFSVEEPTESFRMVSLFVEVSSM